MDRETIDVAIEEYSKRIGEVIGVSKKFIIDQRINDIFGALTENSDPMHNDVARATGDVQPIWRHHRIRLPSAFDGRPAAESEKLG
jgi:hypothetical protein